MKTTTRTIRGLKGQRPIVCVTAYDALFASLADEAGADLILVGDSVGNVLLGHPSTVPVSLEVMLHHTAAVARAKPRALILADLPFGYTARSDDALAEACLLLLQESGGEAVKIEGGAAVARRCQPLIDAGIPIIGHVGLQPQKVLELGGYKRFGKNETERTSIVADAKAWQEAGAFAVLAEMLDPLFAKVLTQFLKVPLIGIGCGPDCDGQILVGPDLLGLTRGDTPSFVKRYAELGQTAIEALKAYGEDVRNRAFPKA